MKHSDRFPAEGCVAGSCRIQRALVELLPEPQEAEHEQVLTLGNA